MGREPRVTRRGFECAVAKAVCLVQPAEQETGATQRMIGQAASANDSPRRRTLEERLALPEPVQSFARLAKLGPCPSGGGNRGMKLKVNVSRPIHCDHMLEPRARFWPVALEEVACAGGVVGQADGVVILRGLGEPERLSFVLGGLCESAKFGETNDQVEAVVDRRGGGKSEILVDAVHGYHGEIVGH